MLLVNHASNRSKHFQTPISNTQYSINNHPEKKVPWTSLTLSKNSFLSSSDVNSILAPLICDCFSAFGFIDDGDLRTSAELVRDLDGLGGTSSFRPLTLTTLEPPSRTRIGSREELTGKDEQLDGKAAVKRKTYGRKPCTHLENVPRSGSSP
jgi:hypothetical protein